MCQLLTIKLTVRRILLGAALLLVAGLPPIVQAAPRAYVANYGTNTLSVIDTDSNTVLATVPVNVTPTGVAVSPDGSRVYIMNRCVILPKCDHSTVSVIDTKWGDVLATVHVGPAYALAASPDGSRVYVTSPFPDHLFQTHPEVTVIDTASDTVVKRIQMPTRVQPFGVAVSPDSSRVYVVGAGGESAVFLIDTKSNTIVARISLGKDAVPQSVVLSPDGRRLYVADKRAISVIDTAKGHVVTTFPVNNRRPNQMAFSPDGSRAYVTYSCNDGPDCPGEGAISVIDTANGSIVATVPVGIDPSGIAVSPDGRRVYTANTCLATPHCLDRSTVSVIDTASNSVVATVPVGGRPKSEGAFVGPGALIATNSSASGLAGEQLSGVVPMLTNTTTCVTTDAAVQQPTHGEVILDANTGAWTYTPASATYSGADAFTWRGRAPADCTGADSPVDPVSNTAVVSLTLEPR